VKRWLFLTHRWLGVFGCGLVMLWFHSGFVMMYMPFPALTDSERLTGLPELTTPSILPAAALATVPATEVVEVRLLQPVDRPIYALRLLGSGWLGLDGRSGERLVVDALTARRAAERFAGVPAHAVERIERIERDQWSISSVLDPHRPLFAVQMVDGGLHYVSSRTGEVVRDTQRAERGWNWVGAVVHWVYPTALRSRATVWHWTVIVLSGYALLTALLGTVIGLLRWRRYASGRRSPYTGWTRWHHLLGLGGALFVLAWLLSGLLSMNPGDVFSSRRLSEGQLQDWGGGAWQPALPTLAHGVKEVRWLRDRAGTLAWLRRSEGDSELRRDGHQVAVDAAFVRARAAALGFGAVQQIERLDKLDLHYHARNAPRPLPVWRLRFDDEAHTWVHVDGRSGQPFGRVDASNRAARWLYHGLHSWDFEPLLQRRPLWDLLMLTAMAAGTALSITSVVIAWRRVRPRRAMASARVMPLPCAPPTSHRSLS